ncbi:reverse transcriptase domain-containing protein [Tanacetum coccineum]|uniref:Reverse transcriptase domain-containing protein n=1 Tax=Tanacetum coccineum TaxID=301880 RepID=A0ABQ4WB49_9ASTR
MRTYRASSNLSLEDLVSKFINEFFPPSRTTNLRNEISNFEQRFGESFHEAWDRYKDLLRACPHHGFTELHQLDTFYNALNPTDQDSLNSARRLKTFERRGKYCSEVLECYRRFKAGGGDAQSDPRHRRWSAQLSMGRQAAYLLLLRFHNDGARSTTSVVNSHEPAILKQFQATLPPASVKSVEEICVTYGGAHPYNMSRRLWQHFPGISDYIQIRSGSLQ